MKQLNILVPTDFSKSAKKALAYAATLAKKMNAKLAVLHVMDMPEYLLAEDATYSSLPSVDAFVKEYQNEESVKLQNYVSEYPDNEIQTYNLAGNPNKVILEFVEEHQPDLIVMGTKGTSGISEIFIGSNTEKLVRTAPCPVITVNQDAEIILPSKIAIAIDGSDEDVQGLEGLIEIAKVLKAKLNIVRVCTPSHFVTTREGLSMIDKFAAKHKISNFNGLVYNFQNIEDGIFYFAKDYSVDMLAVGTHGRRGLAHFFRGSLSEDVVSHSLLPVYCYKIK